MHTIFFSSDKFYFLKEPDVYLDGPIYFNVFYFTAYPLLLWSYQTFLFSTRKEKIDPNF